MPADAIDSYTTDFPEPVQERMERIRALVHAIAPDATERISYGIPTFTLQRNLVHYAGYAGHIGFYPGPSGIAAFEAELVPFKRGKGSVQFSHDQPLPMDLIERIVRWRVDEERTRSSLPPPLGGPPMRANP